MLPSADVIDLCSDAEETPRPPRFTQKTQSRHPREEDIIVLLTSEDEALPSPPALITQTQRPTSRSHSKAPSPSPSDHARHNISPTSAPILCVHELPADTSEVSTSATDASQKILKLMPANPISQETLKPASPDSVSRASSMSPSPIVYGNRQLLPVTHAGEPESDAEEPFGPLQDIYDEALRNARPDEETDFPRSAFSSGSRPRLHLAIKTYQPSAFISDSPRPPLLTPSFFARLQQEPPRNPPTPEASNNIPPSVSLSEALSVTSGCAEAMPRAQSPLDSAGSRSRAPQPPLSVDRLGMVDAEEATIVAGDTQSSSAMAAVERDVSDPGADMSPTKKPSSPCPPPAPSLTTETTDKPPLLAPPHHSEAIAPITQPSTKETTANPLTGSIILTTHSIPASPAPLPPTPCIGRVNANVTKENVVLDAQTKDPEPDSATEMQEIVDMLLPQTHDLTDEQLLAIGLGYPEPEPGL